LVERILQTELYKYVISTVLWMARSPSNCSCYAHRKNVQ